MKRTKKKLYTISAMYHTLFRNTRKLAVCFATIFSFPPSRKAPYLQKASISVHSSHQSSFQLPSTSSSSPLENKFVDRILRRHKDEGEKDDDDSDPPYTARIISVTVVGMLVARQFTLHHRQTHHFKVMKALVQSVSSKAGAPNHFHKSHQQEDRLRFIISFQESQNTPKISSHTRTSRVEYQSKHLSPFDTIANCSIDVYTASVLVFLYTFIS